MKKQKGFDYINRQRKLKENKTVIGLRESEKLIGQLYPVLIDEKGNVLDGQHRLKANPNWRKEVVKGVDSERKKAMIRIHANWHRRREQKGNILTKLAKVTGWKGATPYAAFLGCSMRTVQRYLPQKYKARQRLPKRQLSLSEEKEMMPHEIEKREELFRQELTNSPSYQVIENLKQGKPSTEWSKPLLLKFLANRLYNNVSCRTEEPKELLNIPEIKEKCDFYLTALELMKTPEEEILDYLRHKRIKHLVWLDNYNAQKFREKQYKEKLDELTNSVTKLVLILNNGSKIEFDHSEIPKVYSAPWYDYNVLQPLLESYVQRLLGLDRFLNPIQQEVE